MKKEVGNKECYKRAERKSTQKIVSTIYEHTVRCICDNQ